MNNDLSDSSNYISCKNSVLKTRLHDKSLKLLDIDGDVCHYVHNSIKTFCSPFNNFIERLLDDLHADSKLS